MSVSSLPEWKQLLLERKRRDEEARERREKQEEEKFASMPAWKRGIIQRRKAKQDSLSDREKEKDVCLLQLDARSPSDGLSDTESSVAVNPGSEVSLSPDPGLWLDAEVKPVSEVSVETIVPFHENPFIRTQSSWRRSRDADTGNESDPKEREKDKSSPRSQDGEPGRGRDIELKIERFRDLSEGREKERGRDRSQGRERENSRGTWEKDKSQWKESTKDAGRERELLKVRKDEEDKETDPTSSSFSTVAPCLRTIRADNIIIIEQERKVSDERRGRWRELEREKPEDDHQGMRGMKMDLRDIFGVGGSITEIRASEVLIIKPSATPEERSPQGAGGGGRCSSREDGEMKASVDGSRESTNSEVRTDKSRLREKEKEKPRGQATVIKEDRKDVSEDNVFVDRGGRVSRLLSKFGEHPKLQSRSRSSDNFLQLASTKFSGDEDEQQSQADGSGMKNVPKRSFSFSDRVVCAKENGLDNSGYYERKPIHSDKSSAPWVNAEGLGKETPTTIKLGSSRVLEKDQFGKHRERELENQDEKGLTMQGRHEGENSIQHRSEVWKVEPVDSMTSENAVDLDGDEGFTMASAKNTEGISFARRVQIRQEGKARAEREVKPLAGEKYPEMLLGVEKDFETGAQVETQVSNKNVSDFRRGERFESTVQPNCTHKCHFAAAAELVGLSHAVESQYRHDSAFTECSSSLKATLPGLRGPDRGGAGQQGPYPTHSELSQQTEDLISKIEKIGDTTLYSTEKDVYRAAYDVTRESKQEVQVCGEPEPESIIHDGTPRSPKKIAPMGISPAALEIQIPRTVFYVADEMVETGKPGRQLNNEEQEREQGEGVERRDSWRIGKPLSRIESLRERIRQRELEKRKQREAQEGTEINVSQTTERRHEERGSEKEQEWEAAAHVQKRLVYERGQEDGAGQTSMTAFNVTQEVSILKTCPQLPVSGPQSKAVRREEVTSEYITAATEVISDNYHVSEDEEDLVGHEEELLRCQRVQHQEEEEEEEEQEELSEEELEDYTSPLGSVQSLSPLPPDCTSLAAMSRIYNLDKVGSRSGLCLRERTVDPPSVHLVNVKPLISNAQQGESKAFSGEDYCGVQTIQRLTEQFQLKDQDVLKSCSLPNTSLKDRETKRQQSPRGFLKHHLKDDAKPPEKDLETSVVKATPHRVRSPTSQLKQSNQTITTNTQPLRSQSPENTLNTPASAPTPASSPSSQSPAHSPSVSPSPTALPTLFSLRSAYGGKVKRGATITVSPKKSSGGGGGGASTGSTAAGSTSTKNSPQQSQTGSTVPEPAKKKYPTVEEIEVIGGYQNLEKSCLIKNRRTQKRGKVCFDEDQLEQVCEYPSETSMLSYTPIPQDLWRGQGEELQEEEEEEEDEEEGEAEGGPIISKSTINMGTAMGRGLRVDESCPR